ncbi:MAG: hypothetical protein ABIO43_11775 [Sphingomicrobium sp.]
MANTSNRSRNNNPEGRNQYSNGWTDSVRDRPMTTAAVAAAAVGAGVFLWSKRDQISNQLTQLSEQIGQWTDSMQSNRLEGAEFETAGMSPAMDSDKSFASSNAGTPDAVKTGSKSNL